MFPTINSGQSFPALEKFDNGNKEKKSIHQEEFEEIKKKLRELLL